MIVQLALPHNCIYQPVSAYRGEKVAVDIPILTASHQMHKEALPIFYRHNTFGLCIFPRVRSLPPWTFQPAHQLAHVRKVHVYVHTYRGKLTQPTKDMIDQVIHTLKKCSNLMILGIIVSFISVNPSYMEHRRSALCVNDVVEAFSEVQGARKVRIRY